MKTFSQMLSASVVVALGLGSFSAVHADDTTELAVVVQDGVLSIDIVTDAGDTVASPTVSLGSVTSQFQDQFPSGTLGVTDERIAVYNPRVDETWISRIAATDPTSVWSDGATYTMDFNEPSASGSGFGRLEVDATAAVVEQAVIDPSDASFSSFTASPANESTNSSAQTFDQGTLDNIMLFEASANANDYAVFTLTGVTLAQQIPASQEGADYTLDLILEVY